MKAKKLLSLVLFLLMVFGTMSVMTASAAETTIYEVANATELNNAFVNAAPDSGIRLTANITSEQTFAVIKNKGTIAIDLNGFSITGESTTIGDFITVGDNTTLFIVNTKFKDNASSIIVNSETGGTSVLCLNGENAALHILNGVEIVMGTNGHYAWNSNYAYCIEVVNGKELIVNGADIYNWMYWGSGIAFSNYDDGAFNNFSFKVLNDSEITAKVACIDFTFTNTLPGKSMIQDCNLSYETSLPYFDDGSSAPKKDFMAIKAVDDDFVLVDVLAEGYMAEYTNIGAYVDNKTLIKNFPKGVNVFVDECYYHDCKDIIKTVKSTCAEDGYTVYECPTCYGTETVTIPATGEHSFDGSECTICGYDAADDCDCNCHAGGIKALFFKIINFFQKLFGQNKVCECGAKH